MNYARKRSWRQTLHRKGAMFRTGHGIRRLAYLSLIYIIIFGLAFLLMYPYIVKIITSFMSIDDLKNPSVKFVPTAISLYFWERTLTNMRLDVSFPTSLYISGVTAFLQMMISSFVGYGFARFRFPGKRLLFVAVIFTMLVPYTTLMLPYYLKFRYFDLGFATVNLINTVWPNVILSLTGLGIKNGLYIFLFRQLYRGMPVELEEAAYIDGAGKFRTYWKVMFPNAKVTMVTVFILAFCWQWTDTSYSSIFLSTANTMVNVLKNVLTMTNSTDQVAFSTMQNIGTLILIAPIFVLYLFAQKKLIQGVEHTGLKD